MSNLPIKEPGDEGVCNCGHPFATHYFLCANPRPNLNKEGNERLSRFLNGEQAPAPSIDELRNWFKKNVEFGEKLDIIDGTIGDIESKRLWSELMALIGRPISKPTTKPYTSEEA
jgi:hypothetical protein